MTKATVGKFTLEIKTLSEPTISSHNGRTDELFQATYSWKEEWIITENSVVITTKEVERFSGPQGAEDQWTVCLDCGEVAWLTNDYVCQDCRQKEEVRAYLAMALLRNAKTKGPKGVATV